MPIGLTAKQRGELSAMLPFIEESITSLKRLITDAKDRTRALAKLTEAEEAQKRHARDVGVPFNAEAFAARRAELDALPKELTVEDGQLSAFQALQRAIGVLVDGPYVRAGRAGRGAGPKRPRQTGRAGAKGAKPTKASKSTRSAKLNTPAKPAKAGKGAAATSGKRPLLKLSQPSRVATADRGLKPAAAPAVPVAPMKRVKPLPLALGS